MDINKYLSNYYKGTNRLSLNAMKYFIEEFNHPEQKFKIIHIAGTNGKGSTAEMLTNILINAGYKVGKFIGPHLEKYNERISINNKDITDCEIKELINIVNPKIIEYNEKNEIKVRLFEMLTIIALIYFYNNKCDFVVLETGLGGLYDSTNIVQSLISIITNIGYDHMNMLGNTLEKIAEQKAGIIKENSETICISQNNEIDNVIIQKCKEKNSLLHIINKEQIRDYMYNDKFQSFSYNKYHNILINLKGKKQIYNAAICLECIEILKNRNFIITEKAIRNGLETVIHKGRFEKISENPTIIYDGGHNEPAIQNFKNSVNMYYKNDKKIYIISLLKKKDYKTILKELLKDDKSVFIFTSGNDDDKYVLKEELLLTAKSLSKNNELYAKDINEALNCIKEKYKDRIVFIIGTFYIYGNVIRNLKNEE